MAVVGESAAADSRRAFKLLHAALPSSCSTRRSTPCLQAGPGGVGAAVHLHRRQAGDLPSSLLIPCARLRGLRRGGEAAAPGVEARRRPAEWRTGGLEASIPMQVGPIPKPPTKSRKQRGKTGSRRRQTQTFRNPNPLETHDDDDYSKIQTISITTTTTTRLPSTASMDPSRGGLQRRPAAARGEGAELLVGRQPAIHPDVDPAPRARPVMQKLAIAAIVVLGCLQFLPATHFRDPNDPFRNWIAFDPSRRPVEAEEVITSADIFSWISCLDLRTLAVLANSTLSSSSEPQNISFNFLIPEGSTDKSPYYKLKVVLPDSNLTITSQKQIKDKLNVATPEGNLFWSFPNELAPILIGTTQFSQKRYVYISADSIIKGKIEDLAHIDLGTHAIAAVEDCSKRFGDYVSIDVLNAIQRTAKKSLVSTEPYDKDACLLDLDVIVVEPRKLGRNLMDSIILWSNAFNLANPRDHIRLAITLAFYNNYLKLPPNWKHANANTDILNFDGPKNVCSEDGRHHQEQGYGETWKQYLDEKSLPMLST